MKERDLLNWTIEVATRFGWTVKHVPAPMLATRQGFVGAKQAAGLPDLIMVHHDPPRLIFAELKGKGGKLTGDQRDFLTALRDVAARAWEPYWPRGEEGRRLMGVYCWTPDDQDAIEQILRTRVLL